MFFEAREQQKKSMFHVERGIDWKRGNAQQYVILMLHQFPSIFYLRFVHFPFILVFKQKEPAQQRDGKQIQGKRKYNVTQV
jgi:hypothetical protein